jgi:hypothetical protein
MPRHARLSADEYRGGNAWFICDRCGQRWRRSRMQVEWDNFRVCPVCLDPRPPQMTPPDVYPEGLPFLDPRAPQDNPDLLMDESTIRPALGVGAVDIGGRYILPNGQAQPVGATAPLTVVESPLPPPSIDVILEDVAIRTGPVFPPDASGST